MYEYIKGEIAELTPAWTVIETGGIGYGIHISLQTYAALEGLPQAKLYVHFVVRDDAQLFYGFATRTERDIFRQLISVSGVGVNTARTILSTFAPQELASLIATENAALLKSVKGLGLKTSQKIIVELKDKILGAGASTVSASGIPSRGAELFAEAVAALSMLGFAKSPSEKAVQTILRERPDADVEEVIRLALKRL